VGYIYQESVIACKDEGQFYKMKCTNGQRHGKNFGSAAYLIIMDSLPRKEKLK
jgi:hypothetical protein